MAPGRTGPLRRAAHRAARLRRQTPSSGSPPRAAGRHRGRPALELLARVGVAVSELGKPYVRRLAGPDGFDCSRLVVYSSGRRQVAARLDLRALQHGRTGLAGPAAGRRPRLLRRARPRRHLHRRRPACTPAHGDVVKVSSLYEGSYASSYVGARRILSGVQRPSTSSAKCSRITLRRIFRVGISSSSSIEKSRKGSQNRLICSTRAGVVHGFDRPADPGLGLRPNRTSGSSVIRRRGRACESPITSACEIIEVLSASRDLRRHVLPPAVTMMSFLRSVITRKPSWSRCPISPVWTNPSSEHLRVASGSR